MKAITDTAAIVTNAIASLAAIRIRARKFMARPPSRRLYEQNPAESEKFRIG
jgi:hypothetical protein